MAALITGFVVAYMAVLLVIPPLRSLAIRGGFVDKPGGRKDHADPVPPIGGLIIFSVYMVTVLLTAPDFSAALHNFWPLFLGLILVLIVGAIDDYRHMNAWLKFSAQFAAAFLIVIPGGAQLSHLGNLFGNGDFELGFMAMPFSVIATVLLINAINLMDGLDGLAGGKSFVVFLWLAVACAVAQQWGALQPLLPLMGALAAFLFYNMRHPLRSKANVFLGDAGSMALGLVIAWFSIGLAVEPDPVLIPISMAWILALPIWDTCAQFYRRAREGRHPFSPDRGHFHHHFVHAGFSVRRSTLSILLIAFILGFIGYGGIMLGVAQWVLTAVWIACLFLHMAVSEKPHRYKKILSKIL